jgi:hypothetical protein
VVIFDQRHTLGVLGTVIAERDHRHAARRERLVPHDCRVADTHIARVLL